MEVISIERSTYEELLTIFNSFVSQMKAMAGGETEKTAWRVARHPGRVSDTEHQPKNVANAPPKWDVGILSNRA